MLNIAILTLLRDLYLFMCIISLFFIYNEQKFTLSQTDTEKLEEIA